MRRSRGRRPRCRRTSPCRCRPSPRERRWKECQERHRRRPRQRRAGDVDERGLLKQFLRRAEGIAIFTASFLLAAAVIKYKTFVEHTLATLGIASYPLAVLVFALVASAPFSVTDAIAVMDGVIFGPVRGSLVNAVGLVIAAVGGYYLARRTAHLLELEKSVDKLPKYITRFKLGSPPFLIALRLLPGVGGTLATQIAAALRVPIFRHTWTMCAVAIPVCTILAFFGNGASEWVHTYWRDHAPHLHILHHHHPAATPAAHA